MLVERYMARPAEHLYHTRDDTFELNDLAGDPAYAEVKARLAAELNGWMASQGDPGASIDTSEQHAAARRGEHFAPETNPLP